MSHIPEKLIISYEVNDFEMQIIIIILGVLVMIAGVIISFSPALVLNWFKRNTEDYWLYSFAIGLRLALGFLLITHAELSKFPLVIAIIGWLSIAAALSILLMGKMRFVKLVNWAINLVSGTLRTGGLFAVVFGGFIIYAFI